jgi:hypothetical protein
VYVAVAALEALEAARSSALAISPESMESGSGHTDAIKAVVKEPQIPLSETVSVTDCKMVLSSGASVEGHLSSANLLVALRGDQLVATSQLLNPPLELQKVWKMLSNRHTSVAY